MSIALLLSMTNIFVSPLKMLKPVILQNMNLKMEAKVMISTIMTLNSQNTNVPLTLYCHMEK